MMTLEGKKLAILAESGYEDLELWYPYLRLQEEGAEITIIGSGTAESYKGKRGYPVNVDKNIDQVKTSDFDGLIIPGGWAPDQFRRFPKIVAFTKEIFESGKTVGAICHAGSLLISANVLKGKTATCFFAIKDDMINAGIKYVDEPVVIDNDLVTSRTPKDLPDFCKGLIETLSKQ